jgi:hypothetical protein
MPDIDDPFLEELEPVATQQGIDVPGSRSGFTDFINFGVYNGNFRVGPPQSASNIDLASSASGSNFLPGWRWVVESGDATAKHQADALGISSSGSNVVIIGSTGSAYFEQIIDIGGSAVQDTGGFVRLNVNPPSVTTIAPVLSVRTQYLNAAGTTTGMPSERVASVTLTGSFTPYSFDGGSEVDPPGSTARYLRLRIAATFYEYGAVTLLDVRRDRAPSNLRLPDRAAATNKRSGLGLYDVYQSASNLFWQPSSTTAGTTTGKRLLNYQLVPIPFSLVNIPSNATTDMQLWGDTALALATPRIGVPWASAIVGASYRLSAIPSAGGANALAIRVQVGGSTVWTPFTIAGSGGAISNEASQAVTADELTAGQQIGVVVDTSSTYAPTTADIAVVVWVAVKYDGA